MWSPSDVKWFKEKAVADQAWWQRHAFLVALSPMLFTVLSLVAIAFAVDFHQEHQAQSFVQACFISLMGMTFICIACAVILEKRSQRADEHRVRERFAELLETA